MGGTVKHEIGKYKRGKDRISKHWHLATFKSCQYHNVDKCDIKKYDIGFITIGL